MTDSARPGKVDVPQVGSRPAPVDPDADHATATMLVRPLHGLDEVAGADGGSDATTDGGLHHVDADVIGATTDGGLHHVDADVIGVGGGELLNLAVADESQGIQRREFARVDAILSVTVAPPFGAAEKIATAAINISGSGAVVSRLGSLQIGDAVSLALRLAPSEPPIHIKGRIVREFGEHLRAIHFDEVHKADRERIVRYVFERQRLELKMIKRPRAR